MIRGSETWCWRTGFQACVRCPTSAHCRKTGFLHTHHVVPRKAFGFLVRGLPPPLISNQEINASQRAPGVITVLHQRESVWPTLRSSSDGERKLLQLAPNEKWSRTPYPAAGCYSLGFSAGGECSDGVPLAVNIPQLDKSENFFIAMKK